MKRALLGVGLLVAALPLYADALDDQVRAGMEARHIPGLSLTIVKDGAVVRQSNYGKANLEHSVDVNPDTVFEMGSVTKQFVVLGILMAEKDGKLTLDDPLSKHLDGLPEAYQPLTLRRCLSHTAGIADYLGIGFDIRRDYSQVALQKLIVEKPLDFEPGLTWMYSNGGYALAAYALEEATGQKWEAYLKERIFTPLGMNDTDVQSVSAVIPHRATGYTWQGKTYTNSEVLRPSAATAAGALVTTAGDMAKWAIALQKGEIFTKELQAKAYEPIKLNSGREFEYGLGWMLRDSLGHHVVEHGGNTYGHSAHIAQYPDENLTVIVLTNAAGQSYSGLSDLVATHYLKRIERKPTPEERPDPNSERTGRILDALKNLLGREPSPDYFDAEAIAMLKTQRGTAVQTLLRAQVGEVLVLRLLTEEKVGNDTNLVYNGYSRRNKARISVLYSPEGKVVRLSVSPLGPRETEPSVD